MSGSLVVLAQGEINAADRLANSGLHFGLTLEPTAEVCRSAINHGTNRQVRAPGIELVMTPRPAAVESEARSPPRPVCSSRSASRHFHVIPAIPPRAQARVRPPWRREPGCADTKSKTRVAAADRPRQDRHP